MFDFTPPEGFEFKTFLGKHGGKVRYGVAQPSATPARGSAVLCPGWTEFIEKYFPVVEELAGRGFAVFVIDWPGQGASDRFLEDPLKGYIDHFDTFVDALADAIAREEFLPQPKVLLAHSMGGAISLSALIKRKLSVEAALFSTPMWGTKGRRFGLTSIVKLLDFFGAGKAYATGKNTKNAFEDSTVTLCEKEWRRGKALEEAFPDYLLDRPSFAWANAAFAVMDSFKAEGCVEQITCPVLVTRAEQEMLVENSEIKKIAARFPDVESKLFPSAKHELMFERDATKAEFWQAFDHLLTRAGI